VAGGAGAFVRYATGLGGFLRARLTPEECLLRLRAGLERREENLLRTLEHGVYAQPESPYLPLLRRAGIELGDMSRLVHEQGVEGALERLHEERVRVSLEEFKAQASTRGHAGFDNPLLTGPRIAVTSGGSRARGRRAIVDLPHLEHEAVYQSLFVEAFALAGRPHALWRPVLPGAAGTKNAIGYAKLGIPVERWFSPNRLELRHGLAREWLLTRTTLVASRLAGCPIPRPRHVPVADPTVVTRWLADVKKEGPPAVLDTVASSAVRVARAACEQALDISGTFIRCGGEPLTSAKVAAVAEAGARAVCHYSMSDVGRAAIACARPNAVDDVHVATDKLAVIQRARAVATGEHVGALVLTTLLPSSPKLLLNVEVDDYGVLERRACGCSIGEAGLDLHVHEIRSFEKLTTEGMSFLGNELIVVLEEVLPGRYGGAPGDYQLVEDEDAAQTKVTLVVSPRLGELDEEEVARTFLEAISAGPAYRAMMAEAWRAGGALRVARREPHTTSTAKVQPLAVVARDR
jgi:hypothetical protein